jgi:hypothetical protein
MSSFASITPDTPLILFVEVKYHKAAHGRIGFGDGAGKGYQPEILRKKPEYLERYMRWLIADNESKTCLFFRNKEVRENSAGPIKKGKQNNFKSGLFKNNSNGRFDITEAPKVVSEWAKSVASIADGLRT